MEEFDITEFAKMFDAALASNNPAVKKALRNFMLIVSKGPFSELFRKIDSLTRRIEILERNDYNKTYKGTSINPYTGPVWISTSGTYTTNSVNPVTTSSYSSALNTVSLKDLEIELTSILKNVNET